MKKRARKKSEAAKSENALKTRLEIAESRIRSLESDYKALHTKLSHIDDLLFATMAEVREKVIKQRDIADIAAQERRVVERPLVIRELSTPPVIEFLTQKLREDDREEEHPV